MSVLDNSCIETGLLCRNAFRSTVLVISFKVRPSHALQCVLQMVIKLLPVAANKAVDQNLYSSLFWHRPYQKTSWQSNPCLVIKQLARLAEAVTMFCSVYMLVIYTLPHRCLNRVPPNLS